MLGGVKYEAAVFLYLFKYRIYIKHTKIKLKYIVVIKLF